MYLSLRPRFEPRFKQLPAALLLMNVSACGWVDSTGVQGTTVTDALRNAQPVVIFEGTSLTAPLAGEGAELSSWRWDLDASDVRSRCASIDGFDEQLSATSLSDACSQPGECSISIEESADENSPTQFTLTMPALRSPVALSYRLSATRDDGALIERQQLLCGVSLNEAPLGSDDHYLVLLDETLVVNASDSNNLLFNDSDDDDIRNTALSISDVTQQPIHASRFSFDALGGFTYAASATAPVNDSGYAEDSFVYSVTDGLHVTFATAFIRIAVGNTAPTQIEEPVQLVRNHAPEVSDIRNQNVRDNFSVDVSLYFSDVDDDELTFSANGLPENVSISARGIISGRADRKNRGKWLIQVMADDGNGGKVTDRFQLKIK